MPERKLVYVARGMPCENVAGCCAIVDATEFYNDNGPGNGAICRKYYLNPEVCGRDRGVRNGLFFLALQANREVALRTACGRWLQAGVDRGIRRLKIPVDGGKLVEAVLDILSPFYWWQDALRVIGINLGI